MPRIYVEFAGLEQVGSGCKTAASRVDTIETEFWRTIQRLDWDVRYEADINSTAKQISRKLEKQAKALKDYQKFINDAYNEYVKLDEYGDMIGEASASVTLNESDDGMYSTGEKIWKTATTVFKGATAVIGCAASWVALSPVAPLSTVYAVNSLVSCFSDIDNLWWGDESKVGEVNLLKDALADSAGDFSEMIGGNRDVGELIGKCVYNVGDLVVNIENAQNFASVLKGETRTTLLWNELKDSLISKSHITLKDRIIQNNTTFDTVQKAVKEIPTAISGLVDIAMNSPIGSIAKDYKLLSYQIKNLNEVVSATQLLKEVAEVFVDGAKNLTDLIMPTY